MWPRAGQFDFNANVKDRGRVEAHAGTLGDGARILNEKR